jgi:transcriptional repressor NrdR
MRCPFCSESESRVTDSRDNGDGVRRRRQCSECGQRFTTVETVQLVTLWVEKRDGRREEFSREKMGEGVRQACRKRPVPVQAIERLLEEVERELLRLNRAEVPTQLLGEMVIQRLRQLDHVSYVRFASVYRNFADAESFKREVDSLLGERAKPSAQAQFALPFNGVSPRSRALRRGRKARA